MDSVDVNILFNVQDSKDYFHVNWIIKHLLLEKKLYPKAIDNIYKINLHKKNQYFDIIIICQ